MSNQTNNGTATYIDRSSKVSELDFVVRKIMGEAFHFMPVIVDNINDDGTIDVIPLLFKTTAIGENQRRAPIYNVPVPEIRAGNMAIIATPVKGQKGFVKVCDRDISKIKRTLNYSDVGSFRKHSFSDSVWDTAGSEFNEPAEYYFEIKNGGDISCKAKKFNIEAEEVNINSKLNVTGNSTFTGGLAQTGGNLSSGDANLGTNVILGTHKHGGVLLGDKDTGVPK